MTSSMVLLAWALVAAVPQARAALSALATPPAPRPASRGARVLVVRPCAGREPFLARSLSSSFSGASSASIDVVFAIERAEDDAAPFVDEAAAHLRASGVRADVVVSGARGPNRKVQQIVAAIAAHQRPWDVLVVADSDVDLSAVHLGALLEPLEDPSVGAAWCPPVEVGAVTGPGDVASQAVLAGSLQSFPLLAALDGESMVGKLFALRHDAFDAVDRLRGLDAFLGEDVELARRFGRLGLRVVVAKASAPSLMSGRTLSAALARYARWIQVVRAQRPHLLPTYPLFFFPTLPILACAIAVHGTIAWLAALVALSARALVAAAAARASGREPSVLGVARDVVVADVTLAIALVRALASREVEWRGRSLQILSGGRLAAH